MQPSLHHFSLFTVFGHCELILVFSFPFSYAHIRIHILAHTITCLNSYKNKKQGSSMDAKTIRRKVIEEQVIHTVL